MTLNMARRGLSRPLVIGSMIAIIVVGSTYCEKNEPVGVDWEGSLRACALITACGTDGERSSLSFICSYLLLYGGSGIRNRSTWYLVEHARLRCAIEARSCGELKACIAPTPAQLAACEDGRRYHCVGDVAVDCGNGTEIEPHADDCAAAGLRCGVTADYAGCGIKPCIASSGEIPCDGDLLLRCDSLTGMLVAQDCQFGTGGTCAVDASGHGYCEPVGEPCTGGVFEEHCDGHVAVRCHDREVVRWDCQAENPELTCFMVAVPTCNLANECSSGLPPSREKCDDGVIGFCLSGKWTEIDCRALGYSGCAVDSTGENDRVYCTY